MTLSIEFQTVGNLHLFNHCVSSVSRRIQEVIGFSHMQPFFRFQKQEHGRARHGAYQAIYCTSIQINYINFLLFMCSLCKAISTLMKKLILEGTTLNSWWQKENPELLHLITKGQSENQRKRDQVDLLAFEVQRDHQKTKLRIAEFIHIELGLFRAEYKPSHPTLTTLVFDDVVFDVDVFFTNSPNLRKMYFRKCKGRMSLRDLRLDVIKTDNRDCYELENTEVEDIIDIEVDENLDISEPSEISCDPQKEDEETPQQKTKQKQNPKKITLQEQLVQVQTKFDDLKLFLGGQFREQKLLIEKMLAAQNEKLGEVLRVVEGMKK